MESLRSLAARQLAYNLRDLDAAMVKYHRDKKIKYTPVGKELGYYEIPDIIKSHILWHFTEINQLAYFGSVVKSKYIHKIELKTNGSIRLKTTEPIDYAELFTGQENLIDRCVPELRGGIYHLKFLQNAPIHNGLVSDKFYLLVGSTSPTPSMIIEETTEDSITVLDIYYDRVHSDYGGIIDYDYVPNSRTNFIQPIKRTHRGELRDNFLLFDNIWPHTCILRYYT